MVHYTVSGTATSGSDYQTLSGTVIIPQNGGFATIPVVPIDDTLVEGPETMVVTLDSDPYYATGGLQSATVTIADND